MIEDERGDIGVWEEGEEREQTGMRGDEGLRAVGLNVDSITVLYGWRNDSNMKDRSVDYITDI